MGNKPDVISLQGELFLAKIINGAVSGKSPLKSKHVFFSELV